ncbi:MAG: restriction endonuclease subunit S [Campylobacterota bacterium]|nr:restriction endonuclease subunit S [Campylobacterota bacterium]
MAVYLGDFAIVRTGLVAARKKARLDSLDSMIYKQISLRCFSSGILLDKTQTDDFVSAEIIHDKYLTKEGDVVVRLRSPGTAVYIDKEDEGLLITSLLAVIRANNPELNTRYLAYYINSHFSQKLLQKEIKGTAIPMLKTKDLEKLQLSLPSLEKQKKTVRFLDLAGKEQRLLLMLAKEKEQLSQAILDTIIQQNKDNN